MKQTKRKINRAYRPYGRLYKALRREVEALGYDEYVDDIIAGWINRSPSYVETRLAGNWNFRPSEIRTIIAELGYEDRDSQWLFPPLGINWEEVEDAI
jgi:hypothetical protein